ncbi:MAG: GNAT family N-acetyltransferase [Verrucomicrobiales bacterium]|nr:GNAT family N-acetyltransferase [Verrucomicrobiales bacterium]
MSPLTSCSPDQLATCFTNTFPRSLGKGRMQSERTWNGERLFLYISWELEKDETVASVKLQYYPYRNEVWIGALSVQERFRGNGFGKQIVQSIEQGAVQEQVEVIRLFTRRKATGFWTNLGYRAEEDSRYLRKTFSS